MKLFFAAVSLALAVPISVHAIPICRTDAECAPNAPSVCATDGIHYYLLANACGLAEENCRRSENNEPLLQTTSPENCRSQTKFEGACLDVYDPVCVMLDKQILRFSNHCSLENYIEISGNDSILNCVVECPDAKQIL